MIDLNKKRKNVAALGDLIAVSPLGFSVEKPKSAATATTLDVVVADTTGNFGRGAYQPTRLSIGRGMTLDYNANTKGITLDTLSYDHYDLTYLSKTTADNTVEADVSSNLLVLNTDDVVVDNQVLTVHIGQLPSAAAIAAAIGTAYRVAYPFSSNGDALKVKFQYAEADGSLVLLPIYYATSQGNAVMLSCGTDLGFVLIKKGTGLAIVIIGPNQVSLVSSN